MKQIYIVALMKNSIDKINMSLSKSPHEFLHFKENIYIIKTGSKNGIDTR